MRISSILKKVLVAVTGLCMVAFLLGHLAGNLLLYAGAGKFNEYAAFLESKPFLVYPAETGLILFFLLHLYLALKATLENNAARPDAYAVKLTAGDSTLASRTMIWSGAAVALFIVAHVWMFKFGDHDGPGRMYGMVVRAFANPLIAICYVLAMVVLGFHLSHCIASAFQTLGLLKPHWRRPSRWAGMALGWALAAGFALFPLWGLVLKPVEKVEAGGPAVVEKLFGGE
jgi:succinate dehydrogenase / fumarate reductase cytochrome b subunit